MRKSSRDDQTRSPLPPPEPLLTVSEAAALLRISERTLRRLLASGAIACVHIGRSVRIRRDALNI